MTLVLLSVCGTCWLRSGAVLRVVLAGCAEGQRALIIPRGRAVVTSCLRGRRWRDATSTGIVPLAASHAETAVAASLACWSGRWRRSGASIAPRAARPAGECACFTPGREPAWRLA
jgi:hypothetical protein